MQALWSRKPSARKEHEPLQAAATLMFAQQRLNPHLSSDGTRPERNQHPLYTTTVCCHYTEITTLQSLSASATNAALVAPKHLIKRVFGDYRSRSARDERSRRETRIHHQRFSLSWPPATLRVCCQHPIRPTPYSILRRAYLIQSRCNGEKTF